jgi:hypothetical protein
MKKLLLAVAALLAFAAPALAADPMEGRLAAQVARTSQCASWDWGAPCAWVNVEAFAPVFFRDWSYGSWGPLTVHDPDTGRVVQNVTDAAIPDYAAQGAWRTTENPDAADLAAVFIDFTRPQARVCEVWNFDWKWWTGPTARHGGCMDYTPGEPARAFPWPMGSQASGLRYVDGVVTVAEWRAWVDHGDVPDHELQVAVPLACRTFRAPRTGQTAARGRRRTTRTASSTARSTRSPRATRRRPTAMSVRWRGASGQVRAAGGSDGEAARHPGE